MAAKKFFPEYGSNYSFPRFEELILDYWKKQNIFEKTLDRQKRPHTYSFYDGPPFATGLPHYGHLVGGMMKDIVPRYWTMQGFCVPRRFGWDCHGLPIEFEIEKTLGLSGSLDIQDYGVAKFNKACRGTVQRYSSEWRKTVERMGRWVDMDNAYKTMDPEFMESVWWVFKELWNKGLVYEGKKVVPYSWRLTAPLSNFEASLNYKSVQDPAITLLLALSKSHYSQWQENTALAIWTTTPWTLPANLAVAIQPNNVSYGRYKLETPIGKITHVIVGDERAKSYDLCERTDGVNPAQLVGSHYRSLFNLFVEQKKQENENPFRVILADYVTAGDGTGLVHNAPAFGEEDYYACMEAGLTPADHTDMQANFTDLVLKDASLKDTVGMFVKDADKIIIKELKNRGLLFKQDTVQHNVAFCERSDTPLINKAVSSWFVKVEPLKEQMLKNNEDIRWVPEHIKHGRFGKWLENARDWCISRNRFWGTPIPVWICEKCGHQHVVGSRSELNELAGKEVPDLHKHFVDEIVVDCPKCKCASSLKRVPQVLDCWFESGSMPYAQKHYPFENKEEFSASFPANFIAEGVDQTRCWFYNLTVLSTALFDKPAFTNCIVNGIVLAEDGKKMSKRLKNYPDPQKIFDTYGADAVRLYLMQSPAMHAQDLRFSERGLVELMRAVMLPLWNSYSFFASYANIDEWAPHRQNEDGKLQPIDQWIRARAKDMEHKVHAALQNYRLNDVAPALIEFIDDLTNWYIRLNRDRFWAENNDASRADKNAAYGTLFLCLKKLSLLLAPGLPFISESLWAALHGKALDSLSDSNDYESVHQHIFEKNVGHALDKNENTLCVRFNLGKKLILLGRALRGEAKIGLRQPLAKMTVAGLSSEEQAELENAKELIKKEVNIKELLLVQNASELVEENARPNFKRLGKKLGKDIKSVQQELAKWKSPEIVAFQKTGTQTVSGHVLVLEDVDIVRSAKTGKLALADYGYVAELDTEINDSLIREGLTREIINRIQQKRKELNFHLADRIEISAWGSGLVLELLQSEAQTAHLISQETLCEKFTLSSTAFEGQEAIASNGDLSFVLKKI